MGGSLQLRLEACDFCVDPANHRFCIQTSPFRLCFGYADICFRREILLAKLFEIRLRNDGGASTSFEFRPAIKRILGNTEFNDLSGYKEKDLPECPTGPYKIQFLSPSIQSSSCQ